MINLAFLLLPLGVFGLMAAQFARARTLVDLIERSLKAWLVLFLLLFLATEALSALQLITAELVRGFWAGLLIILLAIQLRRGSKAHGPFPQPRMSWPQQALVAFLLLLVLANLLTSLLYPPNTFDSMTYHMARVMHWIDQHSVAFYPTAISRQNFQMPLAEFAILHLYLLAGQDWFANLVQWASHVLSIGAVVLIARELQLSRQAQLLSAAAAASLPMAILQSSSTQNDLVVSLFVLCFALFILRLATRGGWQTALLAGLSLSLALLSKGTAYLYCAALGVCFSLWMMFRPGCPPSWRLHAVKTLSAVVLMAAVLNVPHLTRNYQFYGNPLGDEAAALGNQQMSLPIFVSNLMRNGVVHLITPSPDLNSRMEAGLQAILGDELNNPASSYRNSYFTMIYLWHEDFSGNPFHLLLILLGCLLLWRMPGRRLFSPLGVYLLAGAAGWMLYCLLISWQIWASRLQLPLFLLAAPLIGGLLAMRSGIALRLIQRLMLVAMLLYAIPFVAFNASRPLLSDDWAKKTRDQLYFLNHPNLYPGYSQVVGILQARGVREAGLWMSRNDWEYPLWVIGRSMTSPVTYRHLSTDQSPKEQLPTFLVATRALSESLDARYRPIFTSSYIALFQRD